MNDWPETYSAPLPLLFGQSVREANAATRVFQAEMRALLRGLRAADLPPYSLGSLLLSTLDPSTKGPLSEARLLSELSNMFVAGADTTGNTLAWALVRERGRGRERGVRSSTLGTCHAPPPLAVTPGVCLTMQLHPVMPALCSQYLVSLHPGVEARVEEELKGLGLCGPGAKELEVGDLGRLRWLSAVVKVGWGALGGYRQWEGEEGYACGKGDADPQEAAEGCVASKLSRFPRLLPCRRKLCASCPSPRKARQSSLTGTPTSWATGYLRGPSFGEPLGMLGADAPGDPVPSIMEGMLWRPLKLGTGGESHPTSPLPPPSHQPGSHFSSCTAPLASGIGRKSSTPNGG